MDDSKFSSDESEDTNDQFNLDQEQNTLATIVSSCRVGLGAVAYGVSESSVQESTDGLTQFERTLLGRFTQKRSQGDDSDERAAKSKLSAWRFELRALEKLQ